MSNDIGQAAEETGEIRSNPETRGLVCPSCKAEYRQGFTICSDCKIALVSELPVPAPEPEPEAPSYLNGIKCQQHPDVNAVVKCRVCSSGVCSTCDIQVSGVHFCPKCIENAPDEKISPRRKRLAVGSVVLAAYCTVVGILTFSGLLYQALGSFNAQLWSLLIMYGLYIPSVIGTALAFSAFERRLKNTQLIWTALIWSSTMTGLFILIEVASRFLY
jgi:hypothetical protein